MTTVYPHITTSADLLNSTVRLDELLPFLVEQQTAAAALVNTRLYGVLPFWEACRQAGIHSVLGFSTFIELEGKDFPVTLYAETNEGYRNLLKAASATAAKDRQSLPEKWATAYKEGIVCVIPNKPEWTLADRSGLFASLKAIYGNKCYGSVARPGGHSAPDEEKFVQLCGRFALPLIATQECHYLKPEEAFSYEVASAIAQGAKLSDDNRKRPESDAYVPAGSEFNAWFSDHPEWIEEAARLLYGCRVSIPVHQQLLPVFPLPENTNRLAYITELCEHGLKERGCPDSAVYKDRLTYELSVISSMGYIDYFLIVADFMKFAREKGIMTGPGRGSSAGSLTAYALHITDVDPIQHGLLFERFLNPERVTLPDIDIDFTDQRRHEVIEYVARKYGANRTAQIITFGTLSAKAVARDTARVFGFEAEELDAVSKMIPNKLGITLKEAYASSKELQEWIGNDKTRNLWFNTARALEGLPRHASTHAAGIILSPTPLVDHVPVEKGAEGIFMTQWPMHDLEKLGLLKMDFLGLRNLTILERIRRLLYNDIQKWLDYRKLPLDDENTYKLLAAGDTAGVFQLESDGMKQALRQIRPTAFGDIVAVNALFRPGPMEFIPLYARRKHGQEEVRFLHPILEPILGETYGVIVYQEQIMQIAATMAGFSLGQADLLRRAVSKKKREALNEERKHFVSGARANGFEEQTANDVYDLIVRFADYGFPKSHAVAYSMISYQLAYMKANFAPHFYAAMLTSNIGNSDKISQLVQEVKEKGITLLSPSIQKSFHSFSVEDGKIRFGLGAVKGVPGTVLKAVLEARNDGTFSSLFDIAERISAIHFKRKAFEPLVKAGALDDFGISRSSLLASLDAAVKHAELVKPTEDPGLFDDLGGSFMKPKYTEASPIPERLKLDYEKEVLGFYLSVHPVEREKEVRNRSYCALNELKESGNRPVLVLGELEEVKRIRTKKGDAMAFLTLQDESGTVSVTLFPKEYAKYNALLEERAVLEIEGVAEFRNRKISIICKSIHQ